MVKQRKAQVTAFILIGLLMFSVLGFFFYIISFKKQLIFSEQKEELNTLFQKTGKYNTYVQSCVQEAVKRGLLTIGTQGGVMYDTQAPGTKPFLGPPKYSYGQYILPFTDDDIYNLNPTEDKVTHLVSYGILKPDLSLGLESHPNVPFYPYGFRKLVADPTLYSPTFTNIFGNMVSSPLPPLCDYYGKNSPQRAGALYSCETYDSKREVDDNSLQEYLEAFIASDVEACVKIEDLPELQALSVEKKEAEASVTFTSSGIDVDIDFSITVPGEEDKPSINLEKFHTSSEIRLKQIHELLTRLIKQDTANIFFDIQRDANQLNDCKEPGNEQNVPCLKEGMSVYKYLDVCLNSGNCPNDGKYDDILVIEDKNSLINGKPYQFFAAVENRIPALDVIRDEEFNPDYADYHYVLEVGDELIIRPKAYDPDEDTHDFSGTMEANYVYSGWKEDYDEIFNSESCLGYDLNYCVTHMDEFSERTVNAPRKWSQSALFQQTKKDASLVVKAEDIGTHKLRVSIMDNEGLYDFQDINIIVVESPQAGGYNDYETIPNNKISLEDPFHFIDLAEFNIADIAPGFKFRWTIGANEPIIHASPELTIPESPIDISTINNEMTSFFGNTLGEVSVLLELLDEHGLPQGESEHTFELVECYPYYNALPPYPFTAEDQSNPFLGNHACCTEDYQIADTSVVCYEGTQLKCKDGDIYRTEITAHCDGIRGNICAGGNANRDLVSHSETLVEECPTDCQLEENTPTCV